MSRRLWEKLMPAVLTEHHETRGEEGHSHQRPTCRDARRDSATPPTSSHRAWSSKFLGIGTMSIFSCGLFSTQHCIVPVWDCPDRLFRQAIALRNTTPFLPGTPWRQRGPQQQDAENGVMAGTYSGTSPGGRSST